MTPPHVWARWLARERERWKTHLDANLVNAELDFFSEYSTLMRNYSRHFDRGGSVHIDLTEDQGHPPSDLVIEVRVLKTIGQVFTEEGVIYLEKGTQHTMHRLDAEPYIRQGKLEHIV